MDAIFFPSAAAFHAWLAEHHAGATEVLVGFYKKDSGQPGITYAEALDEALCYGWIDGIRKGVDAARYTIRFTPRKRDSIWSQVNIRHIERLIAAGRMQPEGLRAFEARKPERTGIYSFEQGPCELAADYQTVFAANAPAWAFFQAQPPSYRQPACWWVMSAKREETRQKRLATLIADSAAGRRLAHLTRPGTVSSA
jgi:uncharacterized protein YdeI (YjbR/CyaY-like superfamily)